MWGLGALSFGYAFFQRVAPSVMVEDLMRDFVVTGAVLGNLSAIYFYIYASLQVPIGMALDYWGPRRMLTIAMLVAGSGSALFSIADDVTTAYFARFLIGMGSAVGFVGSLKIATHWFPPNRFAFVSGMSMFVAMTGGVIGQAPLAAVVDAVGWRNALLGAGVFALVLACVTWLVLRDRPPGEEPAPAAQTRNVLADLGQIVTGGQYWIVAFYAAVMSGPMLSYAGLWGVPHLMEVYQLDRPTAAGSASVLLFGWMLGAPSFGWLSDRMGRRRRPMALTALISLCGWLIHLYAGPLPLPLTWVLLFVIGASSGGMVISYAAARDQSTPTLSGAAVGFVNMASVGSGALLQPLIGWLLDIGWDGTEVDGARHYSLDTYSDAFLTLPVCAVLALASCAVVRETFCRPLVEPARAT